MMIGVTRRLAVPGIDSNVHERMLIAATRRLAVHVIDAVTILMRRLVGARRVLIVATRRLAVHRINDALGVRIHIERIVVVLDPDLLRGIVHVIDAVTGTEFGLVTGVGLEVVMEGASDGVGLVTGLEGVVT